MKISMRRRNFLKGLAVCIMVTFLVGVLCACGSNKWVGTYGGTSSSGAKVEITINGDGTVEYDRNGDVKEGTWTENENSIVLDFGGAVSSKSEPLIVTMSSDKSTITVESYNSSWTADVYQRR